MNKNKPLAEIRRKRSLSLRDLYFKINKEISLCRLSDINVARETISQKEINILDKYLKLSEKEIKDLEEMEEDKAIEESYKILKSLYELVPKDLKAGQEVKSKLS